MALYLTGAFDAPPLPGDRLGWRRFHTPEPEGDLRIGERFTMSRDGLTAIEIRPVATGAVQGRVRLALQAFDGVAATVVRSAEVDAIDLVRNDAYRFEFAPVRDSAGRLYQLEISSSVESPSRGVALWATKGDRFRDGALTVNGMERWADLAFQTHSTPPPPRPAWLNVRHPLVQVTYAGLALSWIGVLYALRYLTRHDESLRARRI